MILIILTFSVLFSCISNNVEGADRSRSLSGDEMAYENGRFLMSKKEMNMSDEIVKKGRTNMHLIEVFVMLDYSIYEWWLRLYNGDHQKTEYYLRVFYAHVFKKIKMRYNLIDLYGKRFDIAVVDIKIAKSKAEVPFVENKYKVSENEVDSYSVLLNLTNWLKTERRHFPRYDVFAFFSKYSLGVFNGLAWPEAICTDHGVSITREIGFYGTYDSASHEIGHNLGSHHDNDPGCEYDDMYIMAPGREDFDQRNFGNRHVFSSCSLGYFEKNIRKINSESSNCLVIKSAKTHLDLNSLTKEPFARTFNADKQCQIQRGPGSFFCASSHLRPMCRSLTCWDPVNKECVDFLRDGAGDGTPCENKKICLNEVCQYHRNAPKGKEGCFHGDWKGNFEDEYGRNVTCKDVARRTYLCYLPDIAKKCCDTCGKIYQPKHGCEYGDHILGCRRDQCTYSGNQDCCKTCEVNPNDPCAFGDKASWCRDISPHACYQVEDTCCVTCKKLEDKSKKDCRYGDKLEYCENKVRELPLKCKTPAFRSDCCHSCRNINASACLDLDPAYCPTIQGNSCYQEYAREACCKRCESLKKRDAPRGCEYGDLSRGCTLHHCKSNKATCCYTCRNV